MPVYLTADNCTIHCPYCMLALPQEVEEARLILYRAEADGLPCPRCGHDLLSNAPLEEPAARRVPTVPCATCAQPIDPRAMLCYHCKARQPRRVG